MRTRESLVKGRKEELGALRQAYLSKKGELVVLYGRRRVGKSTIIQEFCKLAASKKTQKPLILSFEGLEGYDTPGQITHFAERLRKQIQDEPLLNQVKFNSWTEVFDILVHYCSKQKLKPIIVFDEFQWMAVGQSKLVALVKFYWDNHWKARKIMLILCGSIASFMVKKVLRSKALYGRFTLQLHIKKLLINEAQLFFPRSKTHDELLRYLLVFGGVPKYLEEIDFKFSFEQNIEKLFFAPSALYQEEFDKIFNVHFKEPRTYLKIMLALQKKALSLEEVSKSLKITSSGGVKAYLENLELAEFIRATHNYLKSESRYLKYKISDEFCYFYTHFVLPNKKTIAAGGGKQLFKNKIQKQLIPWFGFAFENFVINNALYIADRLGFADKVESYGPYYKKGEQGVQIDLVYNRSDKTISLCEMKFYDGLASTEIIPEFEKKLKRLPLKRNHWVQKVLLAPNGVTKALRDSQYFDLIAETNDLL